MGNCLVTKLKGVVDNYNLPKYNTFVFKIHAKDKVITPYNRHNFYFRGGTITCVNGKTFNMIDISTGNVLESNLTTKTITTEDWGNVGLSVAEDYVFEYSPKYNIQAFGFNGNLAMLLDMNVNDFNFSPNLYEINVVSESQNSYLFGTFKPIDTSKFTVIRFARTNVDINISDFSDSTLLRTLTVTGKNIHGNIEDLSNCILLNNLECWGSKTIGDALNLFSALVSAGKNSGKLLIGAGSSAVTIGGIPFIQAIPDGAWAIIATFDSSV